MGLAKVIDEFAVFLKKEGQPIAGSLADTATTRIDLTPAPRQRQAGYRGWR